MLEYVKYMGKSKQFSVPWGQEFKSCKLYGISINFLLFCGFEKINLIKFYFKIQRGIGS